MSKESWIMAYERGLANGMSSAMAADTAHERIEQGAGLTDAGRLCADIPIEVEDEQETKHTPEPWVVNRGRYAYITNALYGGVVAEIEFSGEVPLFVCTPSSHIVTPDEHAPNANRIVACVNACAGINPEAVQDLSLALRGAPRPPSPHCTAEERLNWLEAYERWWIGSRADALAKAGVK